MYTAFKHLSSQHQGSQGAAFTNQAGTISSGAVLTSVLHWSTHYDFRLQLACVHGTFRANHLAQEMRHDRSCPSQSSWCLGITYVQAMSVLNLVTTRVSSSESLATREGLCVYDTADKNDQPREWRLAQMLINDEPDQMFLTINSGYITAN